MELKLHFVLFGILFFLFSCISTARADDKQSEFTEQEKEAIKKFRVVGKSAIGDDSFRNSDQYIIRFLKDSDMNVEEAHKKMQKYLEFRKSARLDSILKEDMSDLRKWCNFEVKGQDLESRPILFWPFGNCDLRRIILSGKQDRLHRYLQYLIESVGVVVRRSKTKTGSQVAQAVGIMDLNGFSVRQQACLGCLPFYTYLISTLDTNYPQALSSFSIINTPKAFHNVLATVIEAAAPATKKVVRVYGYDKGEWKPELLKTIPSDQLPDILGGTNRIRRQ